MDTVTNPQKIKRPDAMASWEDKIDDAYGLQIADFISQEWFNGRIIADGSQFMSRRQWVHNRRLFYRGEQDLENYKKILARQSGDTKYLNLDWRPVNVIEKFCNRVSNSLTDENYRIDIQAMDPFTLLEQKKKRLEHKRNRLAMPMLEKAAELGMPDLRPKGYVPEDDEDLEFYTQIKDRPKVEIAEEITIDFIKKTSKWSNIKEQCDKDLVQVGICAAQVYVDKINGVQTRYIDVGEFVHSYVKKNDFSDAYYFGFVDTITLAELKAESNFSEQELRQIAKSYSSSINSMLTIDYMVDPLQNFIDMKIDVLRFCWKTDKKMSFQKYTRKDGLYKLAKRDSSYNGKKSYAKTYNVWLEGNYVIGARKIYNYQECENVAKDEMNNAQCPFIVRATNIYRNRLSSFQTNIESIADQMQYAHLKIQHLLAELKPDVINMDVDALADLSSDAKGEANQNAWKETLSILQVKGVVLSKRVDMGDMGTKEARAVEPVSFQQGSSLASALNVWAYYYQQIRDITGINPVADGNVNSESLVGVNEMAMMAGNDATKHIVRAAIDFDKRVCETISSRIKTIFRHKEAEHLQEYYKRAIGRTNIEAMEAMSDRSLRDFGFVINIIPSGKELQEFKEDLGLALKEGTIDVEDKIEAEQVAKVNIKLALEYLKYRRRKRLKQKAAEDEFRQKLQTESNIAANTAATKNKMQEYVSKAQVDIDKEAKLSYIRVAEKQQMLQVEAPKDQIDFERDVYLEQIKNNTQLNRDSYLEDRKDKRTEKQASQQSTMVDQRQKGYGPVNFETNFDLEDTDEDM